MCKYGDTDDTTFVRMARRRMEAILTRIHKAAALLPNVPTSLPEQRLGAGLAALDGAEASGQV